MWRERPRSVLLAEDETDLWLFPPLRAGWALRGQPHEVRLTGQNARRVVFGAMTLRTGQRIFLAHARQRAPDFQAFLHMVHQQYRGWHVALLLDEDPSHRAQSSEAVAAALDMQLLGLPKRAPELNPMDHLWGDGKDTVSANNQYEVIEQHVTRFLAYLQGLSPHEALTKAGVLSKAFWLRGDC